MDAAGLVKLIAEQGTLVAMVVALVMILRKDIKRLSDKIESLTSSFSEEMKKISDDFTEQNNKLADRYLQQNERMLDSFIKMSQDKDKTDAA